MSTGSSQCKAGPVVLMCVWLALLCTCALSLSINVNGHTVEVHIPQIPSILAPGDALKDLEFRVIISDKSMVIGVIPKVSPPSDKVVFSNAPLSFTATTAIQTMSFKVLSSGNYTLSFYVFQKIENPKDEDTIIVSSLDIRVLEVPDGTNIYQDNWKGFPLEEDNFETPSPSPLWDRWENGFQSAACGAVSGSKALYFTHLGPRFAVTKEFNLDGFQGKLTFYHRYGTDKGQKYDKDGSNLISCDQVEPGEEVVLSYLPSGQDASNPDAVWQEIYEIPILNANNSGFQKHSIVLPPGSFHETVQFRWHQKKHSSFRVGKSHTLNLLDQWALDDVVLEVHLISPTFTLHSISSDHAYVDIAIDSSAPESFIAYSFGDGTHDFPTCDFQALANRGKETQQQVMVRVTESGYLHAVACLAPSMQSDPTRSFLIQVAAHAPGFSYSNISQSDSSDEWKMKLTCGHSEDSEDQGLHLQEGQYMRYRIIKENDDPPSCSYGTLIDGCEGIVTLTETSKIQAVTCGTHHTVSKVATSKLYKAAPIAPKVEFKLTETSTNGLFDVTISTGRADVGVLYTTSDSNLTCSDAVEAKLSIPASVTVSVYATQQLKAISCCLTRKCDDSEVSTWGPVKVRTVPPTAQATCSKSSPHTSIVQLKPITVKSTVYYRIVAPGEGMEDVLIQCGDENDPQSTLYIEPFAVSSNVEVVAISCLKGFLPSQPTSLQVTVDNCCAGLNSHEFSSCQHVLYFHQDTCSDPTDQWTLVTSSSLSGDGYGKVDANNVQCIVDDQLNSSVIALRTFGDLYNGSASDQATRSFDPVDDLQWDLPGVAPIPCSISGKCPLLRRVGATMETNLQLNAGVMRVRMKPCQETGTTTEIWWGQHNQASSITGNIERASSYLSLWRAGLQQSRTNGLRTYVNAYKHPYISVSTPDAEYHDYLFQWNGTEGRANIYVDGFLVHQSTELTQTPANQSLSIGLYVPNAWTGEPLFKTCHTNVKEIQVLDLQVSGMRWCEWQNVQHQVKCQKNNDCLEWVQKNCLMPLYEAICIENPVSTTTTFNPSNVCQFRLNPTLKPTYRHIT